MRIERHNFSIVVLPLVAVVSLALGCSEAESGNSLVMEASFAAGVPRAARDEAIRVEAYLVDSCDSIAMPERPSDAIDSTYTLRNGGEGQSIALPEPGDYGLYALAQDSSCAVVAAGCTPVAISADHEDTVTVVMGAFSGEGCSADEQCSPDTGECTRSGGGTGGVGGDGGVGGSGAGGTGGTGAIGGTGGSGNPSCTVATEEQDCDGTPCNPATLQCSSFGSAEQGPCEACDSDENCWSSLRCVPMYYGGDGERFPSENVGFCLPPAAFDGPGGCNGEEPYVAVLSNRESLSGQAPAAYCGVHEDLTTCYAVEAQLDERLCTQGSDDDCPVGGICRYTQDNGKWDYRCTYLCTSDSECRNRQGWTLTCNEFCGA